MYADRNICVCGKGSEQADETGGKETVGGERGGGERGGEGDGRGPEEEGGAERGSGAGCSVGCHVYAIPSHTHR